MNIYQSCEGCHAREKWRGWLSVLGGFLVHLTLGTIYTFGNITPYLTSYIRAYSSPTSLQYSESIWIFALNLAFQGLSMFVGGIINTKIGPRWTTLLGSSIFSIGVFLTSVLIKKSFYAVLFSNGVLVGTGIGIAYAPPLAAAIKWLPNHKGLVNGIVLAGFGGGAFIFDQVQTMYINPHNKSPDLPLEPGSDEKYFSVEKAADVLKRVPDSFLLLGGCYAVMQLIGSLMISDPPTEQQDIRGEYDALLSEESDTDIFVELQSQKRNADMVANDVPPSLMLRTKPFYILWFMFLVNGQGVVFISTLYKAYGQTFITDDHFLALLGSFASVFNSVGRICWGHFADKVSFRTAMLIQCGTMFALMMTLVATQEAGKALFFIWICLLFFTFSGNFALFPTAIAKSFGTKYMAINFGLLFTSQTITGPVGAILASTLGNILGWFGMFSLVSGFLFIGLILAYFFDVKRPDGKDI